MATYIEIRELFSNSDLLNKVTTATIIYAESIVTGTPDAKQKAWIAQTFSNPTNEAKKVLMGVLAANKDASKTDIEGATDAAIQTQVNLIAPILIDALAGA